jgi:hypothetical protein
MYLFSLEYLKDHEGDQDSDVRETKCSYNMAVDAHAIHLRNLAKFASVKDPSKDPDGYWRIEEFVQTVSKPLLLDDAKLEAKIQKYTSHDTAHLLGGRMSLKEKKRAYNKFKLAWEKLKDIILAWFNAFDSDIIPTLKAEWEDEEIQRWAADIRQRLQQALPSENSAFVSNVFTFPGSLASAPTILPNITEAHSEKSTVPPNTPNQGK